MTCLSLPENCELLLISIYPIPTIASQCLLNWSKSTLLFTPFFYVVKHCFWWKTIAVFCWVMCEAFLCTLFYITLFNFEETSTLKGVKYLASRFTWLGMTELVFKSGSVPFQRPLNVQKILKELNKFFLCFSFFVCFWYFIIVSIDPLEYHSNPAFG